MYVPSPTRDPSARRPSQVAFHAATLVAFQVRMSLDPLNSFTLPLARSGAVHASTVVSSWPSPFGEKARGVALGLTLGAVVSTAIFAVRRAAFPAASRSAIVIAYWPSGTRRPRVSVPRQVYVTEAPLPVLERTVAPAALVTLTVQRTAPPFAARDSRVESRTPSPLGEITWLVPEADAIVGRAVSMRTA